MRTFGIEEEFVLLDQETGLPAVPTGDQLRQLRARHADGDVQDEWLACQIEFASDVCQTRDQALEQLQGFRNRLAEAARAESLFAVSMGTLPVIPTESAEVTGTHRYQEIARHLPGLAADHYLCGLHIHVGIESRQEGIKAMNALRPWMPLLVALAANSPFWKAADTGFASWRTILYRKWSVQGIPPVFRDAEDYEQRVARLVDSEAVLDMGHISWAMRLSNSHPTIEVRMADAQLRAEDSVLLALLIRALVETEVRRDTLQGEFAPEYLDLAFWQGAKEGLEGAQLNAWSQGSITAREQLAHLMRHVEEALKRHGDFEYVQQRVRSVLDEGNGASRQREAFAEGALSGLLRMASRELVS